jgi:hypothetical protein
MINKRKSDPRNMIGNEKKLKSSLLQVFVAISSTFGAEHEVTH